jgi:putative membrane protein
VSLDLILEFIHHLCVFGLAAVLAAEFALVTAGLTGPRLRRLGAIDGLNGGLATLVLVVGFLRVVFWTKIALFVVVGLLSIPPTMAIMRWRRAAASDPAFAVPASDVANLRRFFIAEIAVFAFIPIFAAMMARGIGL